MENNIKQNIPDIAQIKEKLVKLNPLVTALGLDIDKLLADTSNKIEKNSYGDQVMTLGDNAENIVKERLKDPKLFYLIAPDFMDINVIEGENYLKLQDFVIYLDAYSNPYIQCYINMNMSDRADSDSFELPPERVYSDFFLRSVVKDYTSIVSKNKEYELHDLEENNTVEDVIQKGEGCASKVAFRISSINSASNTILSGQLSDSLRLTLLLAKYSNRIFFEQVYHASACIMMQDLDGFKLFKTAAENFTTGCEKLAAQIKPIIKGPDDFLNKIKNSSRVRLKDIII